LCRDVRRDRLAIRQRDADATAAGQRDHAVAATQMMHQAVQEAVIDGSVRFDRCRNRLRREAFKPKVRIGSPEIVDEARPFLGRGGAQQFRRYLKLMRFARSERIVPIGAGDQEGDGNDGVERDDRGQHQRRDLPADSLQVQESEAFHDQLPVLTGVTVGVNR
jgi:hypothetical protein